MTTKTTEPFTVREYLDALVWDKRPRIDRWLIDYAGAEDTSYVRSASRAALLAAVRCVRQPGYQIDQMPVILGPTKCGKTSALRILAVDPAWFGDDLSFSKRGIEATAGKWIVEISNLHGMCGGDLAALKDHLSRSEGDRAPRQFMVVGDGGTANQADYLLGSDNRRFWAVRVDRFDLDRLRVDRDQLWAEAAAAEAAGEISVPIQLGAAVASKIVSTDVQPDLHSKILSFLMTEWSRKDNRQLVAVDLVYSPGNNYRDKPLRRWERADEPEFFAQPANVEKIVAKILEIAEEEVDYKPVGKHRFVVRAHQYLGMRMSLSFSVPPAYFGSNDSECGERAAYIVVSDGHGVEFSSTSLDVACTYVSDKLRAQAMQTTLDNPSSYRITRVKAG